jgi:hypothetical protein
MSDSTTSSNNKAENRDAALNFCDTDKDLLGEKALWQSVLMQAALDATSNPQTVKERIERAKTITWFSMRNDDFLLVCSFADLSPEFVMRGIKSAIAKNKKGNKKRRIRSRRHINNLSRRTTSIPLPLMKETA